MKKFLQEFKAFALRGNVIDMAVGVVIGAAFKSIVDSLVADIIMPFVGMFANKDFGTYEFTVAGVSIRYGAFLSAVLNFALMAFVIFILVKLIAKAKDLTIKKKDSATEAAPATKACPFCLNNIPQKASRCGFCTSILPIENDCSECNMLKEETI